MSTDDAPTVNRELTVQADDLAEAERPLSETVEDGSLSAALACVEATGASSDIPAYVGIELYNALDVRGRERDAARAEVRQAQWAARQNWDALAAVAQREEQTIRERDAARAEAEQLRIERTAWELRMDDLREEFSKIDDVRNRELERLREENRCFTRDNQELRVRDDAAKAVVHHWDALPAGLVESLPDELVTEMEALAALARAQLDGGTGRGC